MIYVVEDNSSIRQIIKAYLELADFQVVEFEGVKGVVESLAFKHPRLCILDVMLGDGNGFELAKQIHQHDPSIPFLFLTARESESDRITGLELGGEDYVIKPFSAKELVLRVQAILRRVEQPHGEKQSSSMWEKDGHTLVLDEQKHEVLVDRLPVSLTALEWKLLSYLALNAPVLIKRERLLGQCLGYTHDGSDRTINTHMKNLRAKLGSVEWIQTVRGFGYAFSGTKKER
ncbi:MULTISPECIES: response regulator transcription factor [Sphaerochaeta]|jgi:DNA-binding response OmpR family regulator|uniref:Transcriptional regulatory protein SrrA n=2 Tax=root TaxID=1 RepID=A0A644XLD9_9ZZZZ|nr:MULTISPECIES: response regulator transcription factor [Sphaerochaeta]MDT3357977.1 response regulator transcription factor [Spirochaetota bacterium]NLA97130.1 response regulator transcription factor [Spirochaetales bacterium]MDD2396065.1 response regulator transcription factor [Sphaerochaeta sp.]MDD3424378.1 response regulator transcription factor [Sphaerochaeta sp.]MDD3456948.1 response regulator transcription factor [Sphaerochaeta sp.]